MFNGPGLGWVAEEAQGQQVRVEVPGLTQVPGTRETARGKERSGQGQPNPLLAEAELLRVSG